LIAYAPSLQRYPRKLERFDDPLCHEQLRVDKQSRTSTRGCGPPELVVAPRLG